MSTVGQVTQRAFKQAGTVYSGKKPPNRETTDGWFGRMEKPSFTSYQFYCAMKALAEVQEKPEEKTIEDLKNFAVAYLLKHSEIPQDEVNNDLEQDVDNESLDEESLEGVLDTGETTSGVTWAITGTVGRISGKALDSLLIIPNVKQDQIESALNQDPISVDGIWDRIRDIGGGVFELKINHTKTKRCEGRKGDGGLIEFTQKATKGRGK